MESGVVTCSTPEEKNFATECESGNMEVQWIKIHVF